MDELTITKADFLQAVLDDLTHSVTFETLQPGDITKQDMVDALSRERGVQISSGVAAQYLHKLASDYPAKYRCVKVRHQGKSVLVLRPVSR